VKELISAETVRMAHAAGTTRLPACPRHCVVTPEARTVAARLGVTLAADEVPVAAGAPPCGAPMASPGKDCAGSAGGAPGAGILAAVRAQVLARIPAGSIAPGQLDQIIARTMAREPAVPQATSTRRAMAPAPAQPQRNAASRQESQRKMEAPTDLVESSKAWCRQHSRSVVFADGLDERALQAASQLVQMRALRPILLGDAAKIRAMAGSQGIPLTQVEVIEPGTATQLEAYVGALQARLAAKGVTREQAREMLVDPLYFGAMMVRAGDVDCCVAGNIASTASVLKAALRVIGPARGMKTVSSIFFMIPPGKGRPLGFADCSVVPEPTTEQLAEIAISSAASYENLTGETPRVAMLSFSTQGSVRHPAVEIVEKATALVKSRAPGLLVEGELQFDAAFVPEVAARKLPGSVLAGRANVFVFPTLAAGNIGYKIAERMGGYSALGPLIQGLDAPMHDLSRGCSAKDMVEVPLLAMKMAFGGPAGA
jgi:phosphotransacetylase